MYRVREMGALIVRFEFPVFNRKYTYFRAEKVEGVKETEYKGRKYLWLQTRKLHTDFEDGSLLVYASPGDVIKIEYSSGSSKKTYYYYKLLVIAKKTERYTIKVANDCGGENDITIENAEILADGIRLKTNPEFKAEMLGSGYEISRSRPSENILAFYYKKWVEAQQQTIAEQEEELEEESQSQQAKQQVSIEIEEPELELEGITPVSAAPARQPAEEKRQQLVRIYLLSMRLPSKYLVQQVKFEKNGKGYQEIRDFSDKVRSAIASRLEGIRREAYERIRRVFCQVEEYGVWIAVTDEAVEEAKRVSQWIQEELKKIAALYNVRPDVMSKIAERYSVKAIPIYMEPENARELLEAAIRKMSEDVEELKERIKEASEKKKKATLRKLEQQLDYRKALLEAFKRYLASIA